MKLRSLLIIFSAFFLGGCSPEKQIVIISTNDIHSAIDRFPRFSSMVEEYRKFYSGNVILVDAGDRWTGNPYADRAPENYKPVIELMDAVGYDIAAFGNHEWDKGIDTLAKRMTEASFEKILANAAMERTVLKDIPQYVFAEVDGLRIGFLGLITNAAGGYPDGFEENFGDIKFLDPLKTAELYSCLADSCDLYVAVTHVGYKMDSVLAVHRPEIDLIIGGHSHDLLPEGKKINNTLVTQAGSRLKNAGVTVITYKRGKITGIENKVFDLDGYEPESATQAMVDSFYDEPELKQVIGYTGEAMDKTALLNLFSDIMRVSAGADFAFYNAGGMRINSLPAGDIRIADVYMAEPFDNFPVIVEMTEPEIAGFILNKFNGPPGDKEARTIDLYPSGMTYKIITDGEGTATDVIFSHRYYPERGRTYKVAMSNYVSSKYVFAKRGQGEMLKRPIADFAVEYLRENSPVKKYAGPRVTVE